jgi:MFS family permease
MPSTLYARSAFRRILNKRVAWKLQWLKRPVGHRHEKDRGQIFSGPILKTTILASLMSTGCQGGYYTITFWVPRFLTTERKLSIVSSTGYLSALIVGSFVGYLVGAWLADRIGRRNLFLIFSLGAIAVVLLYTQLASRSGFLRRAISPVSARS